VTVWAIKIRENLKRVNMDKKAGNAYGSNSMIHPRRNKLQMMITENCSEEKPIRSHCGKKGHSMTRSCHCTFTTYKLTMKNGSLSSECHYSYVSVFDTCKRSILILCTSLLLTGNSGNPSTQKTDILAVGSLVPKFGEDSKTRYPLIGFGE
jgi:hypothetical protein